MSYPGRFLPLPPATRALFLANLAVFLLNALLVGRLSDPGRGAWFAFSWPALWDGYGLGMVRVVTYQFTHSFADIWHLLTNMLALWVFGPMAESRLGPLGTWRLYLWGGLCGALGHLAAAAALGAGEVSLVGAALGYAAYRLGWFVDWRGIAGHDREPFWRRWARTWQARRAARAQQAAATDELQLDSILAKVKAHGLGALTPAERRFLEQQSARRKGGS